ncbi:MAG: protealysin inhibitor emfourin [Pseudomonadota bacterium]
MGILKVERIGGLGGFGSARSRLKSYGEIAFSTLPLSDQKAVEALFRTAGKIPLSPMRDGFSYRITRDGGAAGKAVIVPEGEMPPALIACVKDRIG